LPCPWAVPLESGLCGENPYHPEEQLFMHQQFVSAKAQSRERSQAIAPQQLMSTHRAKAVMALGATGSLPASAEGDDTAGQAGSATKPPLQFCWIIMPNANRPAQDCY
jgi:hypothetical protein